MSWHVRSMVKEDSYLKEKQMIVKGDGVKVQTPAAPLFIEWEKFIKVVENKTHFFLYYKVSGKKRKIGATVLPKKGLDDETVHLLHLKFSDHVKLFIKKETPPQMSSIPFINRAILFVLVLILTGFNNLESYESYEKIKYDIYGIWENVDLEEEPGELWGRKLILKDTVTMEEIKKLRHRLSYKVNWTYENTPSLSRIALILSHAEDQLMARPREEASQTFSGESENWKVENYEVIMWGNNYSEVIEGTLTYKPEGVLKTKHFRVTAIAVFNDQRETSIHTYSLGYMRPDSEVLDVKQVSTGDYITIDSAFLNAKGEKAIIEDLTAVHFKIAWWNEENYFDEDDLEEEIIILKPVNH